MASNKDYDDLLESFMNNSQKVYNDDKNNFDKNNGKLPSSYNTFSKEDSKKKSKKQKKSKSQKPEKTGAAKVFSGIGKVLLGMLMVIGVVGIVCISVIGIYGFNVVHGDAVFDLKKRQQAKIRPPLSMLPIPAESRSR